MYTINSKLKVVFTIAECKITLHKCLLTFRFRVDVLEGESSQDYNGEIPIRIHLNLNVSFVVCNCLLTNVLFLIYCIIITLDGAESVDMREIIEDIPTEQEENPRKRKLSPTEQQQTIVKTSR